MLTDVVLLVVGSFISVIFTALGFVTWVVPTTINDAYVELAGYVGRLQLLFPVDTLASVFTTMLTFASFFFGYKLVVKAWGWVRGADYR